MSATTEGEASKPALGAGLALIGFAVFSLHDALIKSVSGVPTFQIAFFAVLFSFVPFSIYLALAKPERSFRPRVPGLLALRCLFTTTGLLSAFYAFGNLPLAEVYSLLFATPILITLLAIPVLGERVRAFRWFAIALGMTGVIIVLQPGSTELTLGHLAAALAAICTAITSVVTRRIGSREHGVTLILYPMLVNVIVCGALTALVYVPLQADMLLRIASLGMLTVMGQSLIMQAYRRSEAQFVAPMQYSQMLWALFYGALVFDEAINNTVLAGAGIIVLSGLLFIWRELSASLTRPVLRTRNLRATPGPQNQSSETDPLDMTEHGLPPEADERTR
jgi:S-adenosylmethionine uptake transporter